MGDESYYKPIDLDSVFGPESDDPYAGTAESSMQKLEQQKTLSEGKIWRALYHRGQGRTDDLYDPQTGEVIDVIYEVEDGVKIKYYSTDGHTFKASLFEGPIVLGDQFDGQIKLD